MSYDPLYPRKMDAATKAALAHWEANQPIKPYLLTWSEGTQALAFREEQSAINYAITLSTVYGTDDAKLTGPDHDYITCGCGRIFRDGEGCRLSANHVVCHECYGKHPAVVGATMAAIKADEQQDEFNRSRR